MIVSLKKSNVLVKKSNNECLVKVGGIVKVGASEGMAVASGIAVVVLGAGLTVWLYKVGGLVPALVAGAGTVFVSTKVASSLA